MHVHVAEPEHSHTHPHATVGVLRWSLLVTLAYVAVAAVAGVRAHSLALVSEAGHNLADVLALGLSLAAVYIQARPATASKTYGYQRAGVLAAFINAGALVVLSAFIFYEALRRMFHPQAVHAGIMMAVAAAGVVMNAAIALALYGARSDLNIRSAFLHMLGDTVSTAAVIAGGATIALTARYWIDPALSFAIAALILWSAVGMVRVTLNILLEGAPPGIKLEQVLAAIRATQGVVDVHDLHLWSLGAETHALSCHILIADLPLSASEQILQQVNARLRRDFHIAHTTIQFEHVVCDAAGACVIPEHQEK